MDFDCIVVGAGPAGLSAALTLGRARRRVLVLDSGEPRNHAARAMHGVLGHDGLDPAALRARGVEELARYGIDVRAEAVDRARMVDGGVELAGFRARTLILATGLLDRTPAVEGFDAIYGISAHTCPYCDGWEHRDTRIAVLASDRAEHLGRLLRQWSSDVVVLADGAEIEDEESLAAYGVDVVREPVERFVSEDGRLTAIELSGRPALERDALFFHIGMEPRTELATALGCTLDERGYVVASDTDRQTSVDRVYAIGNVADPMHNVPMAIADGSRVGAFVNLRLVDEGVVQPQGAPLG
ncbi:MAG TPA: NAD(P)/FAD-dependent oxidoreductase [Solirubrobacteraceae bacterium]|nr:NAD(P)/FAD-dependent oxidoreductase [Solirubrobacteraceae bacterium]